MTGFISIALMKATVKVAAKAGAIVGEKALRKVQENN